jgi:hypothetical protein
MQPSERSPVGRACALRRLNKVGKANSVPIESDLRGNILRERRLTSTAAGGEKYSDRILSDTL